MSETLIPEAILTGVSCGRISKPLAIDLLLSLVEKSKNPELCKDSILALKNIGIPRDNLEQVYKIIENSLLSDESPLVRNSAVNFVSEQLLAQGENALLWTIRHDSSPLVFRSLVQRFFEDQPDLSENLTKNIAERLSNYARKIGIALQEGIFFLDVECLFAKYIKQYEIVDESFAYFHHLRELPTREHFIQLRNHRVDKLRFNFYRWFYLKINQDIIKSFKTVKDLESFLSLHKHYDLRFRNSPALPPSIKYLQELHVLDLSDNGFKQFPNQVCTLSNLRNLDVSKNCIGEIPSCISKLKSLRVLNLKENDIDSFPSDLDDYFASLDDFQY